MLGVDFYSQTNGEVLASVQQPVSLVHRRPHVSFGTSFLSIAELSLLRCSAFPLYPTSLHHYQ